MVYAAVCLPAFAPRPQFRTARNLHRWPTPGAAWPMKKRVSPGARRAIILIHARSISRLETAFGRCDPVQLAPIAVGQAPPQFW